MDLLREWKRIQRLLSQAPGQLKIRGEAGVLRGWPGSAASDFSGWPLGSGYSGESQMGERRPDIACHQRCGALCPACGGRGHPPRTQAQTPSRITRPGVPARQEPQRAYRTIRPSEITLHVSYGAWFRLAN